MKEGLPYSTTLGSKSEHVCDLHYEGYEELQRVTQSDKATDWAEGNPYSEMENNQKSCCRIISESFGKTKTKRMI
jgi:hypothetical protein